LQPPRDHLAGYLDTFPARHRKAVTLPTKGNTSLDDGWAPLLAADTEKNSSPELSPEDLPTGFSPIGAPRSPDCDRHGG